ncbi:MAG: 30S ribosomal protein S17 [Elusimicrobia bacterium]|nr:30S ribosomal protein S17 [Elusimicrobiota bacterium]
MTNEASTDRKQRKTFEGVVVSDKMQKTRIVQVSRLVRHPFYQKVIKKSSKFSVHDETNSSHEGDVVEIMSTRPLSKTKRWRLVRVVKVAPRVDADKVGAA